MDTNHTTPHHIRLLEEIAAQCFLEGIFAKKAEDRRIYFQTRNALLGMIAREKAFRTTKAAPESN